MIRATAIAAVAIVIAGCGQKGPLRLPDPPKKASPAAPVPATPAGPTSPAPAQTSPAPAPEAEPKSP